MVCYGHLDGPVSITHFLPLFLFSSCGLLSVFLFFFGIHFPCLHVRLKQVFGGGLGGSGSWDLGLESQTAFAC